MKLPEKEELHDIISPLNKAFRNTNLFFEVGEIMRLESKLKLEDLSENSFGLYDDFSEEHDLGNRITVYVLQHRDEFCNISNNSISCGRTGGFSYILSEITNNIVMSEFDLKDQKILTHEFGHFFGLYHAFEEHLFGKDSFDEEECYLTGDRLCDTPPDPGALYEIYVNYSTCEMIGFKDTNGNEYKPKLENYMSYYKPCYLKEYSFTKEQEMIMQLAGQLPFRKRLSR